MRWWVGVRGIEMEQGDLRSASTGVWVGAAGDREITTGRGRLQTGPYEKSGLTADRGGA